MRSRLGYGAVLAISCAALFGSIMLACLWGSADIGFSDALGAILKKLPLIGRLFESSETADIIVAGIRLPRVLSAALVGGALAVCGCALQGLFKNPMADTGVLGVSSGAGLGATAAIVFSLNAYLGTGAVTICAFIGGVVSVILVYIVSRSRAGSSTMGLLLAGMCISSLLTSAQTLIMMLARSQMDSVLSWTMGSFSSSSYEKLAWAAPLIIIGCILLFILARPLDLMLMGSTQAAHMGVNVKRTTIGIMSLTALVCSAAVAISGIISFVGLIIPHILRLLVGPGHRRLIPLSFIVGAAFMTLTDLLARTLAAPVSLPVGVFTSILGAPFFLWLYRRRAK